MPRPRPKMPFLGRTLCRGPTTIDLNDILVKIKITFEGHDHWSAPVPDVDVNYLPNQRSLVVVVVPKSDHQRLPETTHGSTICEICEKA